MKAKTLLLVLVLVSVAVCPLFPQYPIMVSAASPTNTYYAYPILEWDQPGHMATFGVQFSVGSNISVTYYAKVWIQLYYRDRAESKPQLLYDVKLNASTEMPSRRWSNTYTFTKWETGKHEVALNLNWVDSCNLTNWSQPDGTPVAPYSEWNGAQWTHHLEWSEELDFTTVIHREPVDYTPLGVMIGLVFLIVVVGAVISEAKKEGPYHKKMRLRSIPHRTYFRSNG